MSNKPIPEGWVPTGKVRLARPMGAESVVPYTLQAEYRAPDPSGWGFNDHGRYNQYAAGWFAVPRVDIDPAEEPHAFIERE